MASILPAPARNALARPVRFLRGNRVGDTPGTHEPRGRHAGNARTQWTAHRERTNPVDDTPETTVAQARAPRAYATVSGEGNQIASAASWPRSFVSALVSS